MDRLSNEELAAAIVASNERKRRVQWLHDLLPGLIWLICYDGAVWVHSPPDEPA